jgi:hypothetical protein
VIAVSARFLDYHPITCDQIVDLEKLAYPSPTAKNLFITRNISVHWRRNATVNFESSRSQTALVAASDRIWWKELDHRRQIKMIVVDIALGQLDFDKFHLMLPFTFNASQHARLRNGGEAAMQ